MSSGAKVISFPGRAREGLMVCLSANPSGRTQILLRKAYRTASELDADWYAVHVETPSESVQKSSTGNFRALLDNINLAADMGAEVVWLKAQDVVKAVIAFAQERKITRMVVGRTHPTLWNRLLRRSLTTRLLGEARDFDIEVVAQRAAEES